MVTFIRKETVKSRSLAGSDIVLQTYWGINEEKQCSVNAGSGLQ